MARPRSIRVSERKAQLLARIRQGFLCPGDRFLSNREIAAQFGISYQTADRLVRELCAEGWLERRRASGTYLAGTRPEPKGVLLIFHSRARRAGSFGAKLLSDLQGGLAREDLAWKMSWGDRARPAPPEYLPVIWECPSAAAACARRRRPALLLNDRPTSGLGSLYMDSVSTDDFAGGVCAAQLLRRHTGAAHGFGILAGPRNDPRSHLRVAGFQSQTRARVLYAGGWFQEDGKRPAARLLQAGHRGLFCCNDRLAEAVILVAKKSGVDCPPLVGFDDAPVAAQLNLTTIAIPWAELIAGALAAIKRRLHEAAGTSSHQIFMPRPVVRRL